LSRIPFVSLLRPSTGQEPLGHQKSRCCKSLKTPWAPASNSLREASRVTRRDLYLNMLVFGSWLTCFPSLQAFIPESFPGLTAALKFTVCEINKEAIPGFQGSLPWLRLCKCKPSMFQVNHRRLSDWRCASVSAWGTSLIRREAGTSLEFR
jgi:hypothetical protein